MLHILYLLLGLRLKKHSETMEDEFHFIPPEIDEKYRISIEALKSVRLQPPINKPITDYEESVNVASLSKRQLNAILSVKLRPTCQSVKKETYEPRHPVLAELLSKFADTL